MRALSGWDVRDNKGKLVPKSRWYLRHNKRFIVTITAVSGGLIEFSAMRGQRERKLGAYQFLQVYKPLEV